MNKLLGFYGTLKSDFYNYKRVVQGRSELLGIVKTEPIFTMKDLGHFPGVVENGNTAITLEVHRITDADVYQNICHLEGFSGDRKDKHNFYTTVDIDTEFGPTEMFILNDPENYNSKVIEDGNWTSKGL